MLYLYAIADGLRDVDGLSGITGEPLQIVAVPRGVVIAGEVAAAPDVSAEALLAQDRVVRALHERAGALLPMRFGATAADVETAIGLVDLHAAALHERLDAVRGREQMTIRVLGDAAGAPLVPEPVAAIDSPGRRYLQQRAAARGTLPPALAILAAALRPLQRAARIERGRHAGVIGSVYHLIDRGGGDRYRAAAARAAAELDGVKVLVSGPSPAYAFTELDPEPTRG